MTTQDQKDFFQKLERFDWYFEFSDDNSVWRRGRDRKDVLIAEAVTDPIKKKMFDDFQKYYFSGDPWGTEKAPKPMIEFYSKES